MFIDCINLIYPNLCCLCGVSLSRIDTQWCLTCDLSLPRTFQWDELENVIFNSLKGEWPITFASSYVFFKKGNNVQNLMNLFKYKGEKEIGLKLGACYGQELKSIDILKDLDLIIPVPLHPAKLLKRGFNQAEILSNGISSELGVEVSSDILVRNVKNVTQTKKSRYDRWLNVDKIFELKQPTLLNNKHILLVDDVFTTGATVGSCLSALFSANNIRVSVVTIACAD